MLSPAPSKHHHAVQFYDSDNSLFVTVAQFLAEGLIARQPAIVIATPSHRAAIEEHLCRRSIDCVAARREGELLMLDAEETMGLFMVNGQPDRHMFETNVGRMIEQALAGRNQVTVRAYGEMVDVLWKRGETSAAINLELLWNKLADKYDFALLCGYAMGSFYKQTKHQADVAALHTHIVDTKVVPFPTKRRKSA